MIAAGLTSAYLARAKADFPAVPRVMEHAEPAFNDTIDKFREGIEDEKVRARLFNKVRVCPSCKKSCAISLKTCNCCGSSMAGVDLSHSDNIFMGFVHGIAKGKFPYIISLRYQDERFICFDDPLALSPLHFNIIPTDVYISDVRFLFLNPAKGLELINDMFEAAAKAALDQFWNHDGFREKILCGEEKPTSPEDVMNMSACGFNYPPSMYQLHLQFVHMPLTPFHYSQARFGGHFHYKRFFPLEYLRKALALGDRVKMNITENTDVHDIMRKVEEHGVDYDSVHREMLAKCWRVHQCLTPWAQNDFECRVVNGKVFDNETGSMLSDFDAKAMHGEDTKKLQNYGRPYDANGKVTGTYYKYAKRVSDVSDFH